MISSDCPPKDIDGLVERLRSRFEWGLMADMQPPDLETKMAILEKKAELEGTTIAARRVHVHRAEDEIECARARRRAGQAGGVFVADGDRRSAIAMAQQVLKHLLEKQDRRITIDAVQKAVAEKFGIKPAQLREKSNRKEIVGPRQVAMYLVKELTHASLPEIGRAFGGKHHTTVIHSIDKIDEQKPKDPDLNKLINSVIDSFN